MVVEASSPNDFRTLTNCQLDEGNRNMAAAAQMSDLKPLPGNQRARAGEYTGQHRDMIEKVRRSRARPRPRPESSQ